MTQLDNLCNWFSLSIFNNIYMCLKIRCDSMKSFVLKTKKGINVSLQALSLSLSRWRAPFLQSPEFGHCTLALCIILRAGRRELVGEAQERFVTISIPLPVGPANFLR